MNCEEARKLMDGYLDAELDPVTSQTIEQHLRTCRRCEQIYESQRSLARAITNSAPYYKSSPELRQKIQFALRDGMSASAARSVADEDRTSTATEYPAPRSIIFKTPWNWLAMAAAILLTAIVVWNVAPRAQQQDHFLATQLIASHVRSLMANHLTDIASSDQHTVKPWLDERLDFAAPVPDFSSDGFPLVGGRLDYLDNRPVAALVYQRRKHYINLFIWLAEPGPKETTETLARQGYHLLHWTDSDFNYWAVSDMNANDLQTFKELFEKQTSRR
jgi:anti-sigma factor RsiW